MTSTTTTQDDILKRREVNARLIRWGLAPLRPEGFREYPDPRPRGPLGPIGRNPNNPYDE